MLNAVNFVDDDGGPHDAYWEIGFSKPDQHVIWYLPSTLEHTWHTSKHDIHPPLPPIPLL